MADIDDLAYTQTLNLTDEPTPDQVYAMLDEIQTYVNTKVKDNLLQVTADSFGSDYALTDNGVASTTSNLYNKQTATHTFTGGDFTITSTNWADVDATNMAVSITPEMQGDFKCTAQFNLQIVSTSATNQARVRFRLSNGTESSDYVPEINIVTGVTGSTTTIPVSLSHLFEDLVADAASKIKLQVLVVTRTNMTITLLANSSATSNFLIEKV